MAAPVPLVARRVEGEALMFGLFFGAELIRFVIS
jgi:hypothetical protein